MSYQAQDYGHLLGMQGFSETLLHNHFTLYNGYVKNMNTIVMALEKLAAGERGETLEHSSLKRRLGWEYHDMRLHELYFENLGGQDEINPRSSLVEKLVENFGSYQAWEDDFKATANIPGVGWAVLCKDNRNGKLNNYWLDEYQVGSPADCTPLLVLDAWEHSYLLDYGLKRAEYLKNFFKNIDWNVVDRRLNA